MRNMQDMVENMLKFQQESQRPASAYSAPDGRPSSAFGPGQSNAQMQQIGNVFYNLLGMIGHKQGDSKIVGLGNELRDAVQSKKYENLLDQANQPYAGYEKMNLLRTTDMSNADVAKLMNSGNGDLLSQPPSTILSSGAAGRELDLEELRSTPYTRNLTRLAIIAYKTPTFGIEQSRMPKALEFRFRFFTFSEVRTAPLRVNSGSQFGTGKAVLEPGVAYSLTKMKPNSVHGYAANFELEHDAAGGLREIFQKEFNIDPSLSGIDGEHIELAKYFKDRFLTVDCFDSQTQFYFGCCKIPLYELLKPSGEMHKECEIFDPRTTATWASSRSSCRTSG
jgi:hypothetical protein